MHTDDEASFAIEGEPQEREMTLREAAETCRARRTVAYARTPPNGKPPLRVFADGSARHDGEDSWKPLSV